MSQDWYRDIVTLHELWEQPIAKYPKLPAPKVSALRFNLIREEMQETLDAIMCEDLIGIADGVADSIVVLLGTAVSCGIDIRPVWDEVQRSNLTKVGGAIRGDGKQLKPENYSPPDIRSILIKQGGKNLR